MVCEKCESKLAALPTPDKWKRTGGGAAGSAAAGASVSGSVGVGVSGSAVRSAGGSAGGTGASGRAPSHSLTKRLVTAASGVNPLASRCKKCKSAVHLKGAEYCQACAYKGGICAMCGVKVLDTHTYKMSAK